MIDAKPKRRIVGTRGSAGPAVPGESITHAINRMRSQGYSDDQIAGQVRKWHPDWDSADVSARIVKNVQYGRASNGQALRAAHVVQGAKGYVPPKPSEYSGPSVEKAKPYYHKTATTPFFDGQKPDHFIGGGRAGAIPVYVYGHGESGPTGDASTQWNADQVAYAAHEKFANEGGVPGAVFRGVLHPVTDLGAMIRGDKPASVGGVVSDVGNIASNFVPVGKAAGIIGGLKGFKALRAARAGVEEAQTAEEAAKAEQNVAATEKALGANQQAQDAPSATEQLRTGLKGARSQYGVQKAARSEEQSRRAKEVEKALRTIADPDEAMAAAQAAMSGGLPRIDFHGLTELDGPALKQLKTYVNQHDALMPFQKLRVNKALDAAVNDQRVPTPSDMRLIEHVFGKQTAIGVAQKAGSGVGDKIINAVNIPRTLMATADFSALLRQGLVAGTSHPVIWGKALPTMLKAAKDGTFYEAAMQSIKDDPLYNLALAGKVSFTDIGEHSALAAHEEAFASDYAAKALDKIPGVPNVIKGSARAYTGFLNKLRMDLFKQQIRAAQQAGRDVNDEKFLTAVGKVVNAATGRGSMYESAEHLMPALNTMLFSPRLMLSRINYLDPTWYYRLGKDLSPAAARQVRLEALRGLFATAGAVTSTVYLASLIPGVDVGSLDPRSADFGKLKIGDTRIDLAGGFQQYVRLATELATHTSVSSTTGVKSDLRSGKFGDPTMADVIQNFLWNKTAPPVAMAHNIIKGKDAVGNPVTPLTVAEQNFIPLVFQDAHDIYHDRQGGVDGITAAAGGLGLSAIGVGVQTYKPKDVSQTSISTLQQQAKDAGMPPPSQAILDAARRKAELDALSRSNAKDSQGRLDAYLKFYAQETGDHQWDHWIGKSMTDEVAQGSAQHIRDALIGSLLTKYEARVRYRLKARGKN